MPRMLKIWAILFVCATLFFLNFIFKDSRIYKSIVSKSKFYFLQIPRLIWYMLGALVIISLYFTRNINLMPVVLVWCIWKTKLYAKLEKTFGKQQAKLALKVFIVALLFYTSIVCLLRISNVMDLYWGDSNRVVSDLTSLSSNHYRMKTHPFYVLFWQTSYHLLAPASTDSTLALRLMIATISALSVATLSLFISEITPSCTANMLLCGIFATSYAQIYQGGQIVESFIFTQWSLLLALVYIIWSYKQKHYSLLALIGFGIFVIGNNAAYIILFAFMYLMLLLHSSSGIKQASKRFILYILCFLAVFSILLLFQHFTYGKASSKPDLVASSIPQLITIILDEDTKYLQVPNLLSYLISFFSDSFWWTPVQITYTTPNPGMCIYALLLLIPLVRIKHLTYKPAFIMILMLTILLFIFHHSYDPSEIPLFAPVIVAFICCWLAFIPDALHKKAAIPILAILFLCSAVINITGAIATYRFDKLYVGWSDYGDKAALSANAPSQDFATRNPFKALQNIEKLHDDIELKSESSQLDPYKAELLLAVENNDLNVCCLPTQQILDRFPSFSFGLENRRKLLLTGDGNNVQLIDISTGEIVCSYSSTRVHIDQANWTAQLLDRSDNIVATIKEDENGVWLNNNIVPGTDEHINVPNFSTYKYPILMKSLYHEIMFQIINGAPYARLFDYEKNYKELAQPIVWYRDSAYVGLFLEKIGRTDLISSWIESINELYDNNRGVQEPDNLGEILYLESLLPEQKRNTALINSIIQEAQRISDHNGNLTGTTDGSTSSIYQTGWLKFGLDRLGMDDVAESFGDGGTSDSNGYSKLLWFTLTKQSINTSSTKTENFSTISTSDSSTSTNACGQKYPYINTAESHYDMLVGVDYVRPLVTQISYPVTWGDGTKPHIWHSVELFLYSSDVN